MLLSLLVIKNRVSFSFGIQAELPDKHVSESFSILYDHSAIKFGNNIKCYTKKWDGVCEVDSHALAQTGRNKEFLNTLQEVMNENPQNEPPRKKKAIKTGYDVYGPDDKKINEFMWDY